MEAVIVEYFFSPILDWGNVSNCHLEEIDILLICSGTNLKWKGPNVTIRKLNFFVQYETCRPTCLERVSSSCFFKERDVFVINFRKKFSVYEFVIKVYN